MDAPHLRVVAFALAVCIVTACAPRGDAGATIPVALVAAPQPAKRLVVVLPGRRDDLTALKRFGIADAIQSEWPDADVVLTELSFAYYVERVATTRLHDEVIAPALARGYDEIWLTGASLGGMGAAKYDADHPGTVDGIVMLAPYLGDGALLREIETAGGVAQWSAASAPVTDDWQRVLWRHIGTWSDDPAKARNVWLVYGDDDRLRDAARTLAPVLRDDHVLERDGGHTWRVWLPGLREALRRQNEL